MVDLTEISPCDGLLPLTIGATTLTEVAPGAMTSLAPYKGREAALSEALKAGHGWPVRRPTGPPARRARGRCGSVATWYC